MTRGQHREMPPAATASPRAAAADWWDPASMARPPAATAAPMTSPHRGPIRPIRPPAPPWW